MLKTGHDKEELKLLEKNKDFSEINFYIVNLNIQTIKTTFKLYEEQ